MIRKPSANKPTELSWETISEELLRYASKPEYASPLAHLLAQVMQHYVGHPHYEKYFRHWEEHGFHLTPVHFYSPIPDTRTLNETLWIKESELPGIEMNEEGQVQLLREVFPRFRAEYNEVPTAPTAKAHEFYLNNSLFDGTDALVLYCMIRHFQPNTILEVGSGFSSRLSAQASLRNGNTQLICIEPYPDAILRNGFPGLTRLLECKAQEVGLEPFAELGANDILFIDSSHVVQIGGDVNYLFLEILPRLKPGVVVHIHDIFFPFPYRRDWVLGEFRFWTEQFLLQAFLVFNSGYEVLLSNSYMGRNHLDEMRATFPKSPWWGGGSFWMRRKSN